MASALSGITRYEPDAHFARDIGFTATTAFGTLASSCNDSTFNVTVAGAASSTLEVTGATFGPHCTTAIAGSAVCTVDMQGTRFPWTITALATSNIRLDNVHIDMTYTEMVRTCPAAFVDQRFTVTGSTTSGVSWNPRRMS